jgi:hypothetical protein
MMMLTALPSSLLLQYRRNLRCSNF